jgi:hypothetical protein
VFTLALVVVACVATDSASLASWWALASDPLLFFSGIGFALLLGSGVMPAGPVGNELNAVTRRAFVPKAIVQIYAATPILAAGLANAQPASGGVSSITVPVQGSPMTTAQATDYFGQFNQPAGLVGMQEADYNLKCIIVPIQFLGMEGIVQMNAAVVPLLEVRMNDAGNQIAAYASTQIWQNGVPNSINLDGFPLIATSGAGVYGNIDRALAANAFWNAQVKAKGAVAPTRIAVLGDIISCMRNAGGEMPNMAAASPATWMALAADFVASENYRVTPGTGFDQDTQGVRGAFSAIMVGGVPVYMDPLCPDGQIVYFNTRYQSFYIHEAAAFVFTGFASTLPTLTLGYVGALIFVGEFVNVKPNTVTLSTGYSFQTGI